MAFNKAPSQSTYQTKEVKLPWALSNRDATLTKDPMIINGIVELVKDKDTQDNDVYVFKRDGALPYYLDLPSTNIRGMYYWRDEDKLYVAYDTFIQVFTASTGTPGTLLIPFTTTTGDVVFTSFFYEDGTTKIVAGDGEKLWTFDKTDVATECLAADFPTPYKPNFIFLDGYLFLVKKGTSDIYNSNLNDPLLWTAGDFISAEMLPDTMLALSRLNNYVLAFGSSSVEYFFDAGNASGSPLQRNDTPVKQIGFLGGLVSYSNRVMFIGQYETASPSLFILEDFKMDEIELGPIRRFLRPNNQYTASLVSNGGHFFYLLTINTGPSARTFAYDLDTKLWTRWTYGSLEAFPVTYSIQVKVTQGYTSLVTLSGSSVLFTFSSTQYKDNAETILFSGTTLPLNFDTTRWKFMSNLNVVADYENTSLSISWSDDDYVTWSSPRTMSLYQARPSIWALGRFARRALKFLHADNTPCRIMYFEAGFNIGNR